MTTTSLGVAPTRAHGWTMLMDIKGSRSLSLLLYSPKRPGSQPNCKIQTVLMYLLELKATFDLRLLFRK